MEGSFEALKAAIADSEWALVPTEMVGRRDVIYDNSLWKMMGKGGYPGFSQ